MGGAGGGCISSGAAYAGSSAVPQGNVGLGCLTRGGARDADAEADVVEVVGCALVLPRGVAPAEPLGVPPPDMWMTWRVSSRRMGAGSSRMPSCTASGPAMTSSDVCATQVSFVSTGVGGAGMFTGRRRAGGGSMRRFAWGGTAAAGVVVEGVPVAGLAAGGAEWLWVFAAAAARGSAPGYDIAATKENVGGHFEQHRLRRAALNVSYRTHVCYTTITIIKR